MSPGFKRSLFEDQERPRRRGWMGRAYRFFTEDLWRRDHEPLSLLRRPCGAPVGCSFLTLNGFVSDRCVVRASALTYVTVLSLVPLLAVSFAALKGLGFYEELPREVIDPAAWRASCRRRPVSPGLAASPRQPARDRSSACSSWSTRTDFRA